MRKLACAGLSFSHVIILMHVRLFLDEQLAGVKILTLCSCGENGCKLWPGGDWGLWTILGTRGCCVHQYP